MGYIDEEIRRLFIVVVNLWNEVVLGYIYFDRIVEVVKVGIRLVGVILMEFNVIGVCDGIVMGYIGMKYLFIIREFIVDLIEVMVMVY